MVFNVLSKILSIYMTTFKSHYLEIEIAIAFTTSLSTHLRSVNDSVYDVLMIFWVSWFDSSSASSAFMIWKPNVPNAKALSLSAPLKTNKQEIKALVCIIFILYSDRLMIL